MDYTKTKIVTETPMLKNHKILICNTFYSNVKDIPITKTLLIQRMLFNMVLFFKMLNLPTACSITDNNWLIETLEASLMQSDTIFLIFQCYQTPSITNNNNNNNNKSSNSIVKKTQILKSGERNDEDVGNARLIILLLTTPKKLLYIKSNVSSRGAPSHR